MEYRFFLNIQICALFRSRSKYTTELSFLIRSPGNILCQCLGIFKHQNLLYFVTFGLKDGNSSQMMDHSA